MYKVGLIGCGGIAPVHYNNFKATGKARIDLVYDIDANAMQRRAEEWDAQAVDSARDIVESDVDIVVLATPGFARLDYLRSAAAAGKHILSEKPIALNLKEAELMRSAVADAGITCQVHFTQRFNAPLVTLKRLQSEGQLGGTVSAWARLHAPAASARWLQIVESGHWRASKELSGGRINEFCSHTVNWLLWALGRPRTVYGRAMVVTEGFTLDDADYALLECENGVGLLEVNRHAGVAFEENYGIIGHHGSAVLKDRAVRMTPMDGKPEDVAVDENVGTPHDHFLHCIESGETPRNSIDDAIDTLRVCLAFNRSAESGQVENV